MRVQTSSNTNFFENEKTKVTVFFKLIQTISMLPIIFHFYLMQRNDQ
jgi:hypothetical protein